MKQSYREHLEKKNTRINKLRTIIENKNLIIKKLSERIEEMDKGYVKLVNEYRSLKNAT